MGRFVHHNRTIIGENLLRKPTLKINVFALKISFGLVIHTPAPSFFILKSYLVNVDLSRSQSKGQRIIPESSYILHDGISMHNSETS